MIPAARPLRAGIGRAGAAKCCARQDLPAKCSRHWKATRNIIIEFVKANQAWAPLVVFLLAFGKSLAFISLLLPAWAALIGIGTLIMAGGINFWPIWIAASLGAALGDWLSYWIGRKLEYTVQHIWPLSRHPDLIPKGEAFMKKWGAPASSSAASSGRCAPRCR